jgi:hypothetical protein
MRPECHRINQWIGVIKRRFDRPSLDQHHPPIVDKHAVFPAPIPGNITLKFAHALPLRELLCLP